MRVSHRGQCGNWVELNKEPGQSLPSGFPHAMYETDAHQQMLNGLLRRPRKFVFHRRRIISIRIGMGLEQDIVVERTVI